MRMRRGMPWTEEEVGLLRRWYADHPGRTVNLAQVASTLGRSAPNVCRKARSLGLTDIARNDGPRVRPSKAKYTREERLARQSVRMKRQHAEREHPMKGKHHTPEVRARISRSQQQLLKDGEHGSQTYVHTPAHRKMLSERMQRRLNERPSSVYSRCKHGRRADLDDRFFRSSWEANYARFLNLLVAQGQITRWEYEADTFWFEGIKRGVRSYKPDFKVWDTDDAVYYVEVKGWMDAKSKTKLKRMAKYHPDVDLRLFGAKEYKSLENQLAGAILGWE